MLRVSVHVISVLACLCASLGAQAGHIGPALTGSGPTVGTPSVTESKPESKLWFNDGRWWGSLWSASALAFHIHRLDPATHTWIDTGVLVDGRPDSHSDALWDGGKVYIATHEFAKGGGRLGDPMLLQRYSYANGAYTLDAGFPVAISDTSTETLTIAKDSTGTLWAAWKQGPRVFFAHSLASDTSWSTPAVLPGCTSDFTSDDICAIVSFGTRIGVMWNDAVLSAFFFAAHVDGQPDTTWLPVETVLAGESDDHIHLAADSKGRVFAAIKNQFEEVKLLVRDAGGAWTQSLVSVHADALTRPIVLLDEVAKKVHVYATVAGMIREKTSPLDAIGFANGSGTAVIADAAGGVNNPSSTKQNVDDQSGIVVIAANEATSGHYWHHEVPGVSTGNGLVQAPVRPGVGGAMNTFTVTGATPNQFVSFYASERAGVRLVQRPGCGAGVRSALGVPLELITTVRANAAGVATVTFPVPAFTAGHTYFFQAIESSGCRASSRVTEGF